MTAQWTGSDRYAERLNRLAAACVPDDTRDQLADELRSWLYETRHDELPRTPGEMADEVLRLLSARTA